MDKIVAAKDLYLNGDKSAAVGVGPEAAFLLVRRGRDVPPEYAALVTARGNPKAKPKGTKEVREGEDK